MHEISYSSTHQCIRCSGFASFLWHWTLEKQAYANQMINRHCFLNVLYSQFCPSNGGHPCPTSVSCAMSCLQQLQGAWKCHKCPLATRQRGKRTHSGLTKLAAAFELPKDFQSRKMHAFLFWRCDTGGNRCAQGTMCISRLKAVGNRSSGTVRGLRSPALMVSWLKSEKWPGNAMHLVSVLITVYQFDTVKSPTQSLVKVL